jgi:hypothetical protein
MTSAAAAETEGAPLKRVALVGSSGGNLFRLGGSDPHQLIEAVQSQLNRAQAELAAVCFVSSNASMDAVGSHTTGSLWQMEQGIARPVGAGPLHDVNQLALAEDKAIADLILTDKLDGLILVSAEPGGTNKASVEAAGTCRLPVVGSGGSCIAAAEAMGVHFMAASGTTGTTNHTRAIAYAAGLSRAWRTHYQPVDLPRTPTEIWHRYDPRPILEDALPAIFAAAAVIGLCRHFPGATSSTIVALLMSLIPLSVAFVAATRTTSVGIAGMLAGVLAGGLALNGGLLGCLVAGMLAGTLADVFIAFSLRWIWPSTTANILGSGAAGLLAGGAAHFLLGAAGSELDRAVMQAVSTSLDHAGWLVGLCIGAAMWLILLKGVYHSLILPLMVLEFAGRGLSFLAALDVVCLVGVSAGLALAAIAFPRQAGERAPGAHTLKINVLFGTFVEGCYPHLRSHPAYLVWASAAAACGGVILGVTHSYGVSYMPVFVFPFVGSSVLGLAGALGAAFGMAFVGAAALNVWARQGRLNIARTVTS